MSKICNIHGEYNLTRCPCCLAIYRTKNKDRLKEYYRKYAIEFRKKNSLRLNKTKRELYGKKRRIIIDRNKEHALNKKKILHDSYIKILLKARTKLHAKDIPKELIEFKRLCLLINRELFLLKTGENL